MSEFKTKAFRRLHADWNKKLAKAGFHDIEDRWGFLKDTHANRSRTIAFEDRERIADFYRRLDHYITENPNLSTKHVVILTLYSDGKKIKDICAESKLQKRQVLEIIRRYRHIILGIS